MTSLGYLVATVQRIRVSRNPEEVEHMSRRMQIIVTQRYGSFGRPYLQKIVEMNAFVLLRKMDEYRSEK